MSSVHNKARNHVKLAWYQVVRSLELRPGSNSPISYTGVNQVPVADVSHVANAPLKEAQILQ